MKSRQELIKELLELEHVDKKIIDTWTDEVLERSIDSIRDKQKRKQEKEMIDWLINDCPRVKEVGYGMAYGPTEVVYEELTHNGQTIQGRRRIL